MRLPVAADLIIYSNQWRLRFPIWGVVCLLLLVAPLTKHALAGDVVVIHSTGSADRWTRGVTEGATAALGSGYRIHEIMPGSPLQGDEYFEDRFEDLAQEWRHRSVAGVIVDGELAFAFVRKYGEALFGPVPTVICSMEKVDPEYLGQCTGCVVVPMRSGLSAMPEFIFSLRPETTLVVGIRDDSEEGDGLQVQLEAAMEPYQDRGSTLFPGHEPGDRSGLGLTLADAIASSMPGTGVLVLLQFQTDNQGDSVDEQAVVARLAKRSGVPVFVLNDGLLGSGALGGVVARSVDQGREAGRVLARILGGENPRGMLVEGVEPVRMVDVTEAMRLGLARIGTDGKIAMQGLPEGAVLMNTPQVPQPRGDAVPSRTVWFVAGGIVFLLAVLMLRRSGVRKDRSPGSRP